MAISALGVAVLGHYADRAAFDMLAGGLSWPALGGGLLLLQGEGLASSLRLRQLAPAGTGWRTCLAVTARWVAALAVLPARLGEVYGLRELTRRLRLPLGEALNNLFVQRLFDVLVLAMLGLPLLALGGAGLDAGRALAMLGLIAAAVTLCVLRLPWWFALLARLAQRVRHRPRGRSLLRGALHGRRAAKRALSGNRPLGLLLVTALKWLCNLAGLALLLAALVPELRLTAAGMLAIVGNLAAIVPLSGIGGVGLGDAAYAAGLAWYGVAVATAAAAALGVRVLLLGAPLLFCLGVLASEAVWPPALAGGATTDAR